MNSFLMHLQSATQYEQIENVVSFVGEDDSGSFGILPGHGRMMTLLVFGLARFRVVNRDWGFLALPGALAYFVDGQLYLSTRRYLRDEDYERISTALSEQLLAEEENMRGMKEQLLRMEQEMLRRLSEMHRPGEAAL